MASEVTFTCNVLGVYDHPQRGPCVAIEWTHEPSVVHLCFAGDPTERHGKGVCRSCGFTSDQFCESLTPADDPDRIRCAYCTKPAFAITHWIDPDDGSLVPRLEPVRRP